MFVAKDVNNSPLLGNHLNFSCHHLLERKPVSIISNLNSCYLTCAAEIQRAVVYNLLNQHVFFHCIPASLSTGHQSYPISPFPVDSNQICMHEVCTHCRVHFYISSKWCQSATTDKRWVKRFLNATPALLKQVLCVNKMVVNGSAFMAVVACIIKLLLYLS